MSDLAATASATEDDNKLNVARFARTDGMLPARAWAPGPQRGMLWTRAQAAETVADDDRSVAIRIQITDLRLIVA
jgi:hypothetical protein